MKTATWKLQLKPGNIITWNSPCAPWYTITDEIKSIDHCEDQKYVCIHWKNNNLVTYTEYKFINPQLFFQEELNTDRLDLVKAYNVTTVSNTRYITGNIKTKEYQVWSNIKERCYNINNPRYSQNGGNGITMCESWLNNFDRFLADVGIAPSSKHMLVRVNVNQQYNKENCGWVLPNEVASRRNSTRKVTYNETTKTLSDWSKETGLSLKTLQNRYNANWPVDNLLGYKPKTKHKLITYLDKNMSLQEWSDEVNLTVHCLKSRLRRNWPMAQVLGYEERQTN